ncbi:Stf0 family sulfotransferase [Nioella halotolerans]|uniref:Stf0 family sulfotransferase n=1 Tax=Nioella halotolerans TaxID=2303578 RepID=UPI003F65F8A3
MVCATQRCGSTLFLEDMRNIGILGMPEEYFISWIDGPQDQDWRKKLQELHDKARSANGVTAVKIMANQLSGIDNRLATLVSSDADGIFPHVAHTFNDALWVWLHRRDVVEQAISRVIARQTKVYHATEDHKFEHFTGNAMRGYDENYNRDAEYDRTQIFREVNSITLEALTWRHFFESHKITPLEFVYEDVVQDEDMRHLDMLMKRLGIAGPVSKTSRTSAKLGNRRNIEWRERFLREAAGSHFNLAKFS